MTPTTPTPFSPDAAALIAFVNENGFFPQHVTPEILQVVRQPNPDLPTNLEVALEAYPDVVHSERTITGYQGAEILVSVFEPADGTKSGAGIYWVHGGGMIIGDRFLGAAEVARWVSENQAVAVSVEYRLSPEHPYPIPTEDSYAGFLWFASNASDLGVDPARIVVAGSSAGGNLAAAVALLARDRSGPAIAGLLLEYPMLDDAQSTVSAQQYYGVGLWSGTSNDTGWEAFLGDLQRGSDDVPIYAAPHRASDLSGLPPTFIDVGDAELFRDEDVAFASRLWAAGVPTELHVTPGLWHAFEVFAGDNPVGQAVLDRRANWIAQQLAS